MELTYINKEKESNNLGLKLTQSFQVTTIREVSGKRVNYYLIINDNKVKINKEIFDDINKIIK